MSELHIVKQKGKRKKLKPITIEQIQKDLWEDREGKYFDSQHSLISMLLPPAVKAFYADLESEISSLCGDRYSRGSTAQRWGSQAGSITIGRQKISLERRRVRDAATGQEIPLTTYARFQDPSIFDESVFQDGIRHVSQRDYEKGLPQIAASFGVSKSAVSRSWVKSTKKKIEKLLNRDLKPMKIVAVFIDGKRFSKLGVVVALGVGEDGKKHVLGIYQSSTENSASCLNLLNDLEKRGMPEAGLLFVVDGGSGLNKALEEKYQVHDSERRRAIRVRCYFHKWNNLKDSLDEKGQAEACSLFWSIRAAKDAGAAITASVALEEVLKKHNKSALASYHEAKDDLLMIHQLKVSTALKTFFSTTNPIESLNSLLEEDLRRVKKWHDSEHFQRWMSTACLHNEKRMRKIRGYSGLAALVIRLQHLCVGIEQKEADTNAQVA